MATTGLDVDAFREHMFSVYGCTFLYEELSPPYSMSVMPSFFERQNGKVFCVPSPDQEDFYENWLIDRVVSQNKLVPIEEKKVASLD